MRVFARAAVLFAASFLLAGCDVLTSYLDSISDGASCTTNEECLGGLCLTDAQGEGPIVVNAFCNFYRQLEYPGDVQVRMYGSDPARTTFETWVTMERTDQPGLVYAAGGATTIWVDMRAKKAIDLPEWVRTLVG